jgi:hypothetical protein
MRNDDTGFTLSEALIGMVLTLVVIGAGVGALTSTTTLGDTARLIAGTNHSMEAAMSVMVRDLMQAGQGIPLGGIPIPTGGPATAIKRPGPSGTTWTFPSTWVSLPALVPGGGMGPTLLGVTTDAITIFYADPNLQLNQFPLSAIVGTGLTMTVNAATSLAGVDGLKAGDLVLFTNAKGSAMQMVTSVSGQIATFATGDALNLNQRTALNGTILKLQSVLGVFGLTTTAVKVVMVSYYVDTITDPAVPRLTRQVNAGPRLAIALGTENIQFAFDLVDGTTNPSNLSVLPVGSSPNQIRKVNIYMSARSLDLSRPSGQYVRNSMAVAVGLRSLSFVDRYR